MDEPAFDEQLVSVLTRLARGDLIARLPRTDTPDARDGIADLVNVLAEELGTLLTERARSRTELEGVVLELGHVLARHAAGDFSARARRRFDGSPADVLVVQVNAAGEEIEGLVSDLHQQRAQIEREARTRAASRLSAISVLSAGVAHELNNPLTFILMNLQLVQEQLAGMSPPDVGRFDAILDSLRDTEAGVHRVTSIVETLKRLTPGERAGDSVVDLAEIVDSSLRMVRNVVDHKADLICIHHDPLRVHADSARLGQVVINLVHNAALAFDITSISNNRIDVSTRLDGQMAIIEVRDNGVGIPAENHEAIFDAFFSTRRAQDGTGLGLSISRQTMLELGGDLTVQSVPGEGSTFRAVMPVADEDIELEDGTSTPSATPAQPQAQILIVDDEPGIVEIMARALDDHEVTRETGGAAAIAQLQQNPFDLVLCDMMMPDIDGVDVYEACRASPANRETRFVIFTGGVFTRRAREFVERESVLVCHKPVAVQILRTLVSEALADRT